MLALAALGLGAALELVRQTGAGALNTLYAEDGQVFLTQALKGPPIHPFDVSYMGYLHTLPRLLALLAAALPPQWAAAIMSGGSALITTALALLVFRATAGHFHHVAARALITASFVLLPVGTVEVFNDAANLHWFLMFVSFWVLLWRTPRPWELAVGCVVLLLTGLSDPLTLLLAPIVVLRVIALRQWRDQLFAVAWSVGEALQVLGIVASHAHRELPIMTNAAWVTARYAFDVLGRGVFGTNLLGGAHPSLAAIILTVLAVLGLGLLGLIAVRSGGVPQYSVPALAAFESAVFFAVPVVLTGYSAPRYWVVPVLLVVAAVAGVLDRPAPRLAAGAWSGVRLAAVALLVLVWAVDFPLDNPRAAGPTWSSQLRRAETTCTGAPSASVSIAIAPQNAEPGWSLDVTCRDLVSR